MVTVRVDYLFTGACHAPVRSKQGESWGGADGRFWLDCEFTEN